MPAVKTVNRDIIIGVEPAFPFDHIVLCLPEDTVLREKMAANRHSAFMTYQYIPEIFCYAWRVA